MADSRVGSDRDRDRRAERPRRQAEPARRTVTEHRGPAAAAKPGRLRIVRDSDCRSPSHDCGSRDPPRPSDSAREPRRLRVSGGGDQHDMTRPSSLTNHIGRAYPGDGWDLDRARARDPPSRGSHAPGFPSLPGPGPGFGAASLESCRKLDVPVDVYGTIQKFNGNGTK